MAASPSNGPRNESIRKVVEAAKTLHELLGPVLADERERLFDRVDKRLRSDPKLQDVRFIDPDDVVQATFAKGFQRVHTFEAGGPDSLYNWLAKLADNELKDAVKKQWRYQKRFRQLPRPAPGDSRGSWAGLSELGGFHRDSPSIPEKQREAIRLLFHSLDGLNAKERTAVILGWIPGLPFEAHLIMQLSRSEYRALKHRGMQKLRDALGSFSNFLSNE